MTAEDIANPFALVNHSLLNFDGRLAPLANGGGKHTSDMARIFFAALERIVTVECIFADLQQKPINKQPRNNTLPPQADKAFEDNEHHQKRRHCDRNHDWPAGEHHVEEAARGNWPGSSCGENGG